MSVIEKPRFNRFEDSTRLTPSPALFCVSLSFLVSSFTFF